MTNVRGHRSGTYLGQHMSITKTYSDKQINMEGGQSGTYLRLTRASSGPRVSVAKTYRDENETKMNISAQTQRPSSAVARNLHSTAEEGLCV